MANVFTGGFSKLFRRKPKKGEFDSRPQPDYTWFDEFFKSFKDPAYVLDNRAYERMRQADVVIQPMRKLAERVGGMSLTVVGSGKRRDELQEILDQASGVHDALEWLAGAPVEGERFLWLRGRLDPDTEWWIPDLRGCGRRKWKAGGTFYWSGWEDNQVGKLAEFQVGGTDEEERAAAEAAKFDRRRVVVFRPGAGNNPEGDTDLSMQLWLITEMARMLDKSMRIFTERYSLPREILKKQIDMLRPDEVSTVMNAAAAKMKLANARQRMSMSSTELVEMIEPGGSTWQFLTEYRRQLESRVHKLIIGENLSSDSTGSGDAGSSDLSDKQLNSAAVVLGKKISDALSDDMLPFVERINRHKLSRLRKDEPRPYLALRPPVEKQRPTIAELVQILDREVPINTDFLYEVIGTDRPEGQPDVFKPKPKPVPAAFGGDGKQPTEGGGAEQRGDRTVKDSGVGNEDTRKQKPNEDLRNVKKESA